MDEKIRLEISGLSYSQTQTGAYALVLSEAEGNRSLPIIIGSFEAQAIAIELEEMKPSRPLTHDVFKSFAQAFGIELKEVVIYNLKEGVFYAKLVCISAEGEQTEIDARTSDAIALAVRFKCAVFTYEFILKNAGVVIDDDSEIKSEKEEDAEPEKPKNELSTKTVVQLEEMLRDAIDQEDYELASRLRDELNSRK